MESLSVEIYENILLQLVSSNSLGEDFEERSTPFNEYLLPFPSARTTIAQDVTRVSSLFYDLATPIAWQYLVVSTEKDLDLLLRLTEGPLFRETRQPIANYTTRIDFKAWRRVDMERSILLLSRLVNVQVLSIECHAHPGPLWRHPLNEDFYRGLPTMCSNLRRLQLLDAREAPTLEEVAFLSRRCLELRSLHVAHLSEPYRRFVGPEYGDIIDDASVGSAAGEFVTTEHRGDSSSDSSSDESSSSGDSDLSRIGSDEDGDESDDDENDNVYRQHISTRFPVALVGPADEEDGDPVAFHFHKLENLALGMGNIHGSISERRSMRKLVEAMEDYRPAMTQLKRVDVYVPLDGINRYLTPFNDLVKTCVLHMYYRAQPKVYVFLHNITRLLVVVHTAYISIPLGLNHLEEFEILLRRPAFASNFTSPRVHSRMMLTAQALLDILLQDRYPSLRTVVLWKGQLAQQVSIDTLAASRQDKFLEKGITLCVRTRNLPQSLMPARHASPIV